MARSKTKSRVSAVQFGDAISVEHLTGLAAELKQLRDYPPLVRRADGKYEGDILAFVKGLRLSARVVYFLSERLSHTGCDVSWGHLLDGANRSCSPECDVIIHNGHVRKWNGFKHSVMEFTFVETGRVKAIVSCKSKLSSIDKDYPKSLRPFGVKNVFLFAECCEERQFTRLRQVAKRAGYRGVWCLYFTDGDGSFVRTDTAMYVDFANAVLKTVTR